MGWYMRRLLAAVPTQLLLLGFARPTRYAAAPPTYWGVFDAGGIAWLLLWSWVLRHDQITKRMRIACALVAVVPMLAFPFHAYTVDGATASSLGHVCAFLAAAGSAFLAAQFFGKHVAVAAAYLVLFVVFFFAQTEAFSYLHLQVLYPFGIPRPW